MYARTVAITLIALDDGHVDIWPTIQRLDQILMDYDYDYFPRSRVNWRKEDDRSLLVFDPKLNRSPFITCISLAWKIPRNRLLVLTDAMLMEGSSLGRLADNEEFPTESALERIFVERFKTTPDMVLVACSAQNIDRVVTIYRAAKQTRIEEKRSDLVHPSHQVLRCVAWEIQ